MRRTGGSRQGAPKVGPGAPGARPVQHSQLATKLTVFNSFLPFDKQRKKNHVGATEAQKNLKSVASSGLKPLYPPERGSTKKHF
jgi:hypothetical protein